MFAEFLTMYDIHRWLRYVSWLGLGLLFVFFLVAEGGLPPQSWLALIQSVSVLPALWPAHGISSLTHVVNPLIWSVIWGCLWYVALRVCKVLFQHHQQLSAQMARQLSGSWLPANQLSLAVSPQLHAGSDSLGITVPRLRLPQRSPISGDSGSLVLPRGPIVRDVADVPTRPAVEPARLTVPLDALPAEYPAALPLRVGVGWHTGLVRRDSPNEDNIVAFQGTYTYQGHLLPFGLFVVADGMGGHADGLLASRIAMQSMSYTVLQNIIMGRELSNEFFIDMLVGGVEWANMAIFQRAQADGTEMGTTLTAALVINRRAYVVNVGDSRTYLFRDSSGLTQVTRDHSLVASLVAFGEITPDEIYTHPERSKIYRSVGQGEELHIDSFVVDLQPHDRLLLCSDGLWEMVRDPAIERVLRASDSAPVASDRLVQMALRGGGCDNISVVVLDV
ncbi:PP2C family protein-serine/threonine phosphatase [Dictyobacter aurantiacus]|uniref:PPM-type phosphatase domain-containing protein n=1 Tax=Dictyobacter aurantiacus TaxID=1936993 RepID=A0A401ZPW2_9CHLR|nr:protein phosphatase 2C domain-containing protein [Dictyobacter aurantiacus]GCE08905.1 hypothetical protein KDAU_62340 [Dictyobacter aurantiacus]